ncbi:MAG: hypothetical protein NMNS02_22610 [Nitrosomonas sp.]|nr:MAG: hypothetical protein NMNS02_22610 [Nitrosomonas sp.]
MFAIPLDHEVGFMPDTVNWANNHIGVLEQFMQVNYGHVSAAMKTQKLPTCIFDYLAVSRIQQDLPADA